MPDMFYCELPTTCGTRVPWLVPKEVDRGLALHLRGQVHEYVEGYELLGICGNCETTVSFAVKMSMSPK
ncbi:hypothetical protein IG631_22436 [Alternaria alternata]|jgi:hypothetical protein|nr:hypothetical protein IG631_22436 [Alternaria alternata]